MGKIIRYPFLDLGRCIVQTSGENRMMCIQKFSSSIATDFHIYVIEEDVVVFIPVLQSNS
uniref:Uncharacterized protein n=1 Tax=Octopus bimaculoides TaxID=37653 RepID=A0A0L8FP73_OCTBM